MSELLQVLNLTDWAPRFLVVLLRTSGIVVFLPIFGSLQIPVRIRVGLAVVLAFVILPVLDPIQTMPQTVLGWALLAMREISVGLFFGLAAKTIFAGVEMAAGLIATQSGFAMANMVDPLTGGQSVAPSLFQNLLATALFLAADLHHLMLRAMLGSYDLIAAAPAGVSLGHLAETTGSLGMRMLDISVQLAAPALLVTFSVDLLMALVGRTMSQVPILFVGYPVKLAVGLISLVMLAQATGSAIGWVGHTIAEDGRAIVGALAG